MIVISSSKKRLSMTTVSFRIVAFTGSQCEMKEAGKIVRNNKSGNILQKICCECFKCIKRRIDIFQNFEESSLIF